MIARVICDVILTVGALFVVTVVVPMVLLTVTARSAG